MSDITFKFESKINQNKENIIKKYIYKIEKKKIKEFSILIFISIRWHITGYYKIFRKEILICFCVIWYRNLFCNSNLRNKLWLVIKLSCNSYYIDPIETI